MAQAKGVKAQLLGAVAETTYGSDPVSVSAIVLPINSSAIRGAQNINAPATIRNNRNPVQPFLGNINVAGDVVIPVDLVNMGWWLKMFFGAPTTTGATSPYTHVFKVPSALDSWVFEQGYTDVGKYQKFNGCKVKSIAFKFGGDGELTASISITGSKETLGNSSMDSSPDTETFTRLNQFQAAIEEGGSAVATVKELELTLSNELDEDTYVIGGAGIRGSLPEGLCQVSGRIKAMFEDWTLYNKAVNGTESSLKVTLTSGSYSLVLYAPEILYARNAPGIETPGGIWMDAPFQGYYDNNADATVLKATLVNTKAAY